MWGCVLLLAVAELPPRVEVVLIRSVDTSPERSEDLLERVANTFTQAGVPTAGPADTRARAAAKGVDLTRCEGGPRCTIGLLLNLRPRALVTVDVGEVSGRMAVGLEALDLQGKPLAQKTFVVSANAYPAGLKAPLEAFAAEVKPKLPPEAVADAPVKEPAPVLAVPAVAPPPPQWVPPPPATGSPGLALGLGVGAGLAAGGAVGLGLLYSANAAALERAHTLAGQRPASSLTRAEAEGVAAAGNAELGAAIASGAVAVGLAALAIWAGAR